MRIMAIHHTSDSPAMNIERFHNELALRLGYERIVKDKRILISVEELTIQL